MSKHYCYLIRANQHIKIGYSRNVEKRIESMQTGNQYKLELIAKLVFETEFMARQQEKDMHRRYERFRFRGEWFYAEPVLDWLRQYGDAPEDTTHELDILAASPI